MALAQRFCFASTSAWEQSRAFGKFSKTSRASRCLLNSSANRFGSVQTIHLTPLQFPTNSLGVSVGRRRSVSFQQPQASSPSSPSETTLNPQPQVAIAFKHILLPIIDRNPYLSDSTRQTIATTTALAKQYGADVTVVVIDHNVSEEARDSQAKDKHNVQLETIRWHLSEGGLGEYTLVEKVGEGQKPSAVIGEMADDLGLDLVIMSMEAIHHKHIDGNLLGEFVPCPVLMLPL